MLSTNELSFPCGTGYGESFDLEYVRQLIERMLVRAATITLKSGMNHILLAP